MDKSIDKKEFIAKAVEYFCNKLGINSSNEFIANDIIKQLSSTTSINDFKDFFDKNYIKPKYDYKNGIAKFDTIIHDYKQHKLDEILNNTNCNDRAYDLFRRTVNVFLSIDSMLEDQKKELKEINLIQTLLNSGFEKYEIKILSEIGKRDRLMYLCKYNPFTLEQNILEAYKQKLHKQALKKIEPENQVAYSENEVINKLNYLNEQKRLKK